MLDSFFTILVVDDDVHHAEVVVAALEKMEAQCAIAHSEQQALTDLEKRGFDVVITDLMLERPESGLEILKAVKQRSAETEVIVVTGHNSVEIAVEAMRQGAFNYLQKPLDLKQLRAVTEKAGESARLRHVNRELKQRLDEKFGFDGVLGSSPNMLAVIERLKRIAPTDATVLIHGETGTGKELFAQAIHQNSPRKNMPFVALNCGALTESILESELFGHEKGSFTGASADRLGKFEYASGGTLFLDEVGDMPMPTQIKLLRVLENGEVTRVGSNKTIKVNVRILSATNRNLEEAVAAGTFRQDLYHRLKVVTIRIPPLRERTGDIPVLLDHFLKTFAKKYHKSVKGITPTARKIILDYDWPGNVRQLRNAAESMIVVDYDEMIDIDDLPEEIGGILRLESPRPEFSDREAQKITSPNQAESSSGNFSGGTDTNLRGLVGKPLAEMERLFILGTLQATGGNREEAAKMLGIGERTLYRKIKEYGE